MNPDTPESSDLPEQERTHGPLALILSSLRSPAQTALDQVSALAAAGTLNPAQSEHLAAAMNALGQILRMVERYAPMTMTPRVPPAPRIERQTTELWGAGEHPDALDDRFQDSLHPLADDDSRDSEM
jgi:hypothetical protein